MRIVAKKEREKKEMKIKEEEIEEITTKNYLGADLSKVVPRVDSGSLERGLKHDLSESIDETIIQTESKILGLKAAFKSFYERKEEGDELEDEESSIEVEDLDVEEIVTLAKKVLEKKKNVIRKKDD